MKLIVFLAVLALATADHWGVLIAGSNGYGNYRHQADVCHAFQIMKRNGVPTQNIIVFMYDDIASSGSNPYKGQIFNKPTPAGTPGVDVYPGVNKDYTGKDCTAANLLAVLAGDSSKVPAGKPVLRAGPNDNVFIFYSDHGSVGLVAMPVGPYLYATNLIATLKQMYQQQKFGKLVFYLEACESGSMFDKILPNDIKVYATTAANPTESSWGWYCSPNDVVNGKRIGSCLGDEYSIQWMEDSDKGVRSETLKQQFEIVKKATTKSHVCEYGDQSFVSESIFNFQGAGNAKRAPAVAEANIESYGVNSRDMNLHYLYQRYLNENSPKVAEELQAEVVSRQKSDAFINNLGRTFYGHEYKTMLAAAPQSICDQKCCQPVVNYLREQNFFTDYSLKHVRSIVTMCEHGADAEYLLNAVKDLLA